MLLVRRTERNELSGNDPLPRNAGAIMFDGRCSVNLQIVAAL
jgi:hypothetical protein